MSVPVRIVSPVSLSREGIAKLIEERGFTIVAAVESVSQLAADDGDGLTILDSLAPDEQAAAVSAAMEISPNSRPIVLAYVFDFDVLSACFRNGAVGYLVRDVDVNALIAALRLALSGQKVFPSSLLDSLEGRGAVASRTTADPQAIDEVALSQREQQVLGCLMTGYSNKVIARELNISAATVKVHVKAILRKLKVQNRTQAALRGSTQDRRSGIAALPPSSAEALVM